MLTFFLDFKRQFCISLFSLDLLFPVGGNCKLVRNGLGTHEQIIFALVVIIEVKIKGIQPLQ